MAAVAELLRAHPEIALFAALSLGFFLGKRKVGTFSLGTCAGVLLAGVVIGQLRIPIPAPVMSVPFALFVFVVGYRVGPQFFRGLRGDGPRLAALALILSVTGLLAAYAAALLLGYDKGTAAGLLAGSLTQSAILGSAGDAIARLDAGPEVKRQLSDNVSVAYAVSYLFGTAGVAWFMSRVGPRLLGVDLAAACAALGRSSGEGSDLEPSETLPSGPFLIRAFRVQGPPWAGATVGEVEAAHRGRVLIERVRKAGGCATPSRTPSFAPATRWPWPASAANCSRCSGPSVRRWTTRNCSPSRWRPCPWSSPARRPTAGRWRNCYGPTAAE